MDHIPVLKKEAMELLDPKPNENFIDCTIGDGGHALELLERTGPKGMVLGIDWDKENIVRLEKKFKEMGLEKRVILANDNFANLEEIAEREGFQNVSGAIIDLGYSSRHIDESSKGFSFRKKESLDMRYSFETPLTAEKILNFWSVVEIERILKEYGEERFSERIAREIVKERAVKPIKDTLQLVNIIERAIPKKEKRQKIHFATRTFQALRIAVNDELNNLKKVLPQILKALKPQGRILAISFHSLEDRIVKNFFRDKAAENILNIMTKKPIRPSIKEININPRSRSSKLRAAIKNE